MKYLEITDDKHKQALAELNKHAKNGGESVVALTAPWCGHCNALKPELNKMRSKLKGGKGIVANVSDKYHSELEMDTQVDGFPTIRHFKGGKKVKDYEGNRVADDLANFANKSLNNIVQTGGGKKRKTKKRKKRAGGSVMSKPIGNNKTKKNNETLFEGGIEIGNNTMKNDIEYVTLYNTILGRLDMYSRKGMGTNKVRWEIDNTLSVTRAIDELKNNTAGTRDLILDTATMISSYNLDLQDNEVLAIAFAMYISLVGAEQYDDETDIQRMLGLMAYGEEYDEKNTKASYRKKSKKLKNIFIEITTKGDRGGLQSQIRRKMMGLNNPRSMNNSSTKRVRGGRRRKRRKTHNKKKKRKKRSKTKKRGGGLCASRQQPACEDMKAIATHKFDPQNLRSASKPDEYAPKLIVKIGQCGVCFMIGSDWLKKDTVPAAAIAMWLDALATRHNWLPYGKNLSERNSNIMFTMADLTRKINSAIDTVHKAN
jgi:thiol-disulfide isomerase/thioredoxin